MEHKSRHKKNETESRTATVSTTRNAVESAIKISRENVRETWEQLGTRIRKWGDEKVVSRDKCRHGH